jgi:hypothetical protein
VASTPGILAGPMDLADSPLCSENAPDYSYSRRCTGIAVSSACVEFCRTPHNIPSRCPRHLRLPLPITISRPPSPAYLPLPAGILMQWRHSSFSHLFVHRTPPAIPAAAERFSTERDTHKIIRHRLAWTPLAPVSTPCHLPLPLPLSRRYYARFSETVRLSSRRSLAASKRPVRPVMAPLHDFSGGLTKLFLPAYAKALVIFGITSCASLPCLGFGSHRPLFKGWLHGSLAVSVCMYALPKGWQHHLSGSHAGEPRLEAQEVMKS